jgi:hypothetical protein
MTENKIIRVCAQCQQIKGFALKSIPGVAYSHGACFEHCLDTFAPLLGGRDKAREYLVSKPSDYFVPELDCQWIA